MHKPLVIDPRTIRPLPQALWDSNCTRCDKRQSRWELFPKGFIGERKGFPMCSLCWLYESEWGKEHREDVDLMIGEVEASRNEAFKRTEDGRLWACKDADAILGSIAITSRLFVNRSAQLAQERVEDSDG